MRPRELHSDYYRDRSSEYELCRDFPGDEILIDGLHAMQTHMYNNGVNIDIPVVRVMNTAHFLAAYMFATTCSGDQLEYDSYADINLGRDKKLFRIAIIVLAAMLKRTKGDRANQCRNLMLDNRDPDFEEGVTLYDRFLHSAEKHFAEEDFLIDTHQLIQQVNEQKQIIAQQAQEIQTLKYTITTMDSQKPQTIVYNYGTINDIHDNPNATIYACPAQEATQDASPEPQEDKTVPTKSSLPFFVPQKFEELGTYTFEEFETMYHNAVKGGAPKLATFLTHYRDLAVLDFKDNNKKEIFESLKAFFGAEMDFGYPNFVAYF